MRDKWWIFALVLAGAATAARAYRVPNDWAEAHWLIGYQSGFIKRGLVGTLLQPFLRRLESPAAAESVIQTCALIVSVLLAVTLLWCCVRIVRQVQRPEALWVCLVFVTSSYWVMAAHLNGYFDHILILLTIAAAAAALRGWSWLGVGLLTVGVFVHETILLLGLPLFLYVRMIQGMAVRTSRAAGTATALSGTATALSGTPMLSPLVGSGSFPASAGVAPDCLAPTSLTTPLSTSPASMLTSLLTSLAASLWARLPTTLRALLPAVFPLLAFAGIAAYHATLEDPNELKMALHLHIREFTFVEGGRSAYVPHDFLTPFADFLSKQSGSFGSRISDPGSWLRTVPTVICLLTFAVTLRRTSAPSQRIPTLSMAVLAALPLSLFLIAWDLSRIWTYPIIVAFLLMWVRAELGARAPESGTAGGNTPDEDGSFRGPSRTHRVLIWSTGALASGAQVLGSTPLMDGEVDPANAWVRFVQVAIIVASVVGLATTRQPQRETR